MATVEWEGFDSLRAGLAVLSDPPMGPLMEKWERVIIEGNRRGVLSGVDGNDVPMPPLRYRMGIGKPTKNRRAGGFGNTKHDPAEGVGGNLTAAEYRKLKGPRLAPRFERSRVIANLMTQHGRDPSLAHAWFAEGAWFDVVNAKGQKFLMAHFNARAGSRLPRYDLRPVRPQDRRLASEMLADYARQLLRMTLRG